jgi:hypothetical protein
MRIQCLQYSAVGDFWCLFFWPLYLSAATVDRLGILGLKYSVVVACFFLCFWALCLPAAGGDQ